MGVSAHYLDIEWQSEDVARRVSVSTYPIALEEGTDGSMRTEVNIFRDYAPWIGLQLTGPLASIEPCTVNANKERYPWRKIVDEHGEAWWVPATRWNKNSNRHSSEMHRSLGSFQVDLGPRGFLVIDTVAVELNRAHVQEYLEDFRDELIWLALGRPTGASGEVASTHSSDLVNALKSFVDAAGRALEHPVRDIREVTALSSPSRLRPNAETFRAVLRQPGARLYPGRAAEVSADVAENRYLSYMVGHCHNLARSVTRATIRHQSALTARAAMEKARAEDLRTVERIEVDQEIFDNQLADIRRRLDDITYWKSERSQPDDRKYEFSVGKEFSVGPEYQRTENDHKSQFFYNNPDRNAKDDVDRGIKFSVAKLSSDLYKLVKAAHGVDKNLSLSVTGKVEVSIFTTSGSKTGRLSDFVRISSVQPHSPIFERRSAARVRYDREGWQRPLGSNERAEYRAEARIAGLRSDQFEERAQKNASATSDLTGIENMLGRQVAGWENLKVKRSSAFPMGMCFVQNPIYAAALAAFHKVTELEKHAGIGGDSLELLDRINVLHASALYERWCLIKIVSVLAQDFHFVPQGDWVERIITGNSRSGKSGDTGYSIKFARQAPNMVATLDVEPVMANGRRPDFRLRFSPGNPSDGESAPWAARSSIFKESLPHSKERGLVMDAKFRTRWREGELAEMLSLLVDIKKYDQDGDRVFILHPSKGAIAHKTSPLSWGADCDYGHDHPANHSRGSIQMSAAPLFGALSLINLRRLIALELQEFFPEPEFAEHSGISSALSQSPPVNGKVCVFNASFCVKCGTTHRNADIHQSLTGARNPKWLFRCSDCRTEIMQTHCFSCGTNIFKNGFQMTYHLTLADQITNVVCPYCGANF
jgi:hypothetical protein